MKETLLLLANYNIWANRKYIDVLLTLDDETIDMEIVSSFSSLRTTVYHMWGAEYIWLQRLLLVEKPVWIPHSFSGSMADACQEWQMHSKELAHFIERQFSDRAFEHVFQYYDLKKQSRKSTVSTTLLHVMNHGTYHRGQLATMLRQSGVNKIPPTDMTVFAKS